MELAAPQVVAALRMRGVVAVSEARLLDTSCLVASFRPRSNKIHADGSPRLSVVEVCGFSLKIELIN